MSGDPGKAFLITIVFAKVQKARILKTHKNKICFVFFFKEIFIPWPLLQIPKWEGDSMCLGLAMGPQSLAIIPSIAVWQVFVDWVLATSVNEWHR